MSGSYFLVGSIWKNVENLGKSFSGLIRPDWGTTAWANTAGLVFIVLIPIRQDN